MVDKLKMSVHTDRAHPGAASDPETDYVPGVLCFSDAS